jgi:rhodanese-related sulfurtransferase
MKSIALIFLLLIKLPVIAQSVAYEQTLNLLLQKTVVPIKVEKLKRNPDQIFLDARNFKEYKVSHIANAKWVGYDGFNINKLKLLPKDTEIIIYCSVGYRSEKIGEKLLQAGFKNVKNLWGGLFQWINAGLSVVDNNGQPTKKVHAFSPEWGVWLQKGEKVYD